MNPSYARAAGAAGRLIQDYMWSASPSAESPASSGAARACRGHSGAGAAWSRPHSAQMATSQQSQHSAHSSSAARHSHGHPAPHVPAHSHTAALPPHHPQSPGEAAHVHVHANAHANVHVHAHANTHGTGPGAGLPPRASPPAYRSSPRAWAQHPLQDAAAPPAPANNRPAQIQRGFEFQPGTTRGAAGGAAATQPTARSSLSAGDLRNLHPGRSSGEGEGEEGRGERDHKARVSAALHSVPCPAPVELHGASPAAASLKRYRVLFSRSCSGERSGCRSGPRGRLRC